MTPLDIANQIIPGYESLSVEQRDVFEASFAGQQFTTLTNKILTEFTTFQSSLGWLNWMFTDSEERKKDIIKQFSREKEQLIFLIQGSKEYKKLTTQITCNILKFEFADFDLLTNEQQQILANAPFSQTILAKLPALNKSIMHKLDELNHAPKFDGKNNTEKDASLEELEQSKNKIITNWQKQFLSAPGLLAIKNDLAHKKELFQKRKNTTIWEEVNASQLANFFPLLKYKIPLFERVNEQLMAPYSAESESRSDHEEYLKNLLFYCMKKINKIDMNCLNLDNFNKKQAGKMAKEIIQAFNTNKRLELDNLFEIYERKLNRYIEQQLLLINNKTWRPIKVSYTSELLDSLSYLLAHNKTIKKATEFTNKLADAHAFIQYTGFATQNESSYIAILDLYNSVRYTPQIAEAKSIIFSLFRPLLPLYNEYKEIADFERNVYWKVFRTIMPILIVVAFAVLVASLLTPLALPEIAFTVVLIPTIIIGLALAAQYVTLKNGIYKSLREKYYGGQFEIPEFQINERMKTSFKNEKNAIMIQKFYINLLKQCDKNEAFFYPKYQSGTLSEEEIELRTENINKRHLLELEWYDIHSNINLNFDSTPQIVLTRLQTESNHEYQTLQDVLQEEMDSIKLCVAKLTTDLKSTITSQQSIHDIHNVEETSIKIKYSPGFFPPPLSLIAKKQTEKLVELCEQIVACSA